MLEEAQQGSTENGAPQDISEIIKVAVQAVQADGEGKTELAMNLYTQASQALEKLIESGVGSESEVEDWQSKVGQYQSRYTYLQQRVQQQKIQQYANTAKLAQEATQLAAKGQEAVQSAGGPTPLAGAAAVGAGIGLIALGPLGALAGAAGVAYAATTKNNTVGEVARGAGQVAVDGFAAIKNFDTEYNITQKAWSASKAGAAKVTELDKKYKVHDTVASVASRTTTSIVEFEKKNQVMDRLGKGLANALDWTAQKLGTNEGQEESESDGLDNPAESAFPDVPDASAPQR